MTHRPRINRAANIGFKADLSLFASVQDIICFITVSDRGFYYSSIINSREFYRRFGDFVTLFSGSIRVFQKNLVLGVFSGGGGSSVGRILFCFDGSLNLGLKFSQGPAEDASLLVFSVIFSCIF